MMREFLKLLTPAEAWARFEPGLKLDTGWEEIETREAVGRVSAFAVNAPHPLPAFSRSAMDGYAVRARDTHGASESLPAYFSVSGEILMGTAAAIRVEKGQAVLIHTGGMLPEGADAVVMLEVTQPTQNTEIGVMRAVAEGENVIFAGEEVQQGSAVILPGDCIRPVDMGGLLALGIVRIRVKKKPRVGILSTGDEVLPPEAEIPAGKVRDVNSYTIAAVVQEAGGIPVAYGIIPDQRPRLLEAARKALAECDVVVICAGSSASNRDITADVINELGEPGVLVHGINVRPGKPTILSICAGKAVFGLPGNPVSAYVIALHFLRPAIRALLGQPPQIQAVVRAVLNTNLSSQASREDWIPVKIIQDESGYQAEPLFIKSNFIFSLSRADGLICIPAAANGLPAGTPVDVILFD